MTPHPRRARIPVLLAIALTVAAALVACGGEKETPQAKASGGAQQYGGELVKGGTLTFGTDFTTTPFQFLNESNELVGIDIDLCGHLAEHMGLKVDWVNLNFGGLIPALQSKRFDAICAGMFMRPERQKIVSFVPYIKTGESIMVQKDNPHNVKALTDLCGLSVALTVSSAQVKDMVPIEEGCQAQGKPVKVLKFENNAQTIQQVLNGRADAFFGDDPPVAYFVSRNPGKVEVAASGLNPILNGIAVFKGNAQLADAISAAWQAMVADGTYAADLKKWGIEVTALTDFAPVM